MLMVRSPVVGECHRFFCASHLQSVHSNIVAHRILSGDYTEICKWLVQDLEAQGLWNEDIRQAILREHGKLDRIVVQMGAYYT